MGETLEAHRAGAEISASDFDHDSWNEARAVQLTRYWSGDDAPAWRHAEVRALWTQQALYVRFDCQQCEPLVLIDEPRVDGKTIGLWERDVCEIFIAPDISNSNRYFEFEAAPTGEWLDLAINHFADKRETDWEYSSGMTSAARLKDERNTIAMRIPFEGLGRMPGVGDCWRANLFRCVGAGEARGYLAWQPTFTEQPNFHVPDAFGWISFVSSRSEVEDNE